MKIKKYENKKYKKKNVIIKSKSLLLAHFLKNMLFL